MKSFLKKLGRKKKDDNKSGNKLAWYRDQEKHAYGEFSFAVVQANGPTIEDHSQVVSGPNATFVGVYDGHGGPDASSYVNEHLFNNLLKQARDTRAISVDIIRTAFSETEDGFLTLVRRDYDVKPELATVGTCCLVGVIWEKMLFVANLGDSRAVMGYLDNRSRIYSEQLTSDHNVSLEDVRRDVRDLHPDDPQIVVLKQGVWRVKGIIQVSRAIGDAYLKRTGFNPPPNAKFHVPGPVHYPVLRADPTIITRRLRPTDMFLIFASDGLWEFLTNQEAVEIVHNNPRAGIARRLLVCAMEKAARRGNTTYKKLKKMKAGDRRSYHDDITIVVLFIDHETFDKETSAADLVSVRGLVDTVGPENFNF